MLIINFYVDIGRVITDTHRGSKLEAFGALKYNHLKYLNTLTEKGLPVGFSLTGEFEVTDSLAISRGRDSRCEHSSWVCS